MKSFTGIEIHAMNRHYPWNFSIKNTHKIKDSLNQYCIYPTGDYSISDGRTYIYLNANIQITQETKQYYNLII